MNQNNVAGGLTTDDRRGIYRSAGISDANVAQLEAMVLSAGLRDVGRGALRNVVVEHQSKKNGGVRILESHTCELIFAYECELDPAVRGYYAQVPCPYVERQRGGRRHVSSATLDFLVFKDAAVQLVECKTQEWMEAEVKKPRTDWELADGGWRNAALEPYAEVRQIEFIPWLPPSPPGIYLQNLQACYAVSDEAPPPRRVLDAVTRRIQQYPATIDELASRIAGFSPRTALWMLAAGMTFGPWRSISIDRVHDFRLYADKHRAELADAAGLTQLNDAIAQPIISEPTCLASAVRA
jgi:putative transposase